MGFDSVHAVIRSRVADNKPAALLSVVYPNAETTKPTRGPWGRLTILPGQRVKTEVPSNGTRRQVGVAVLQLFDEPGKGDGTLLEIADAINALFDGVTVSGVRFLTPSINVIGVQDGWFQINVECPYNSDEAGA